MKQIFTIGLSIFVIAMLIGYFALSFLTEKQPPRPECQSIKVHRKTIQSSVYSVGTIEPKQLFHIKAKRSGKVVAVMVEKDEKVTEKQRLARIKPNPGFALDLDKLRYDLDSARLHRKALKNDLNKQRKLFERGMVARSTIEEMERNLTKAVKKENLALERLKALEEETGQSLVVSENSTGQSGPVDIYVIAPTSGTILDINLQVGDVIIADRKPQIRQDDQGIAVLADLSELFVECKVNEIDIKNVQVGQSAVVRLEAQPEKAYSGVIKRISTMATPHKRSLRIMNSNLNYFTAVIKIEEPDALVRPGMTCNVQIAVQEKKEALTLPVESIFEEMSQVFVLYQKNDAFEKRSVTTGISNEHHVEIISGLNEDDAVCRLPLVIIEWQDQIQRFGQRNFVERLLQ